MGEAIWRDYDTEALYAQYNNRAMIAPEALAAIKADQERRTDAFRAAAGRAELDVAYGPDPRERLDLFLPEGARPPLLAYIHGGYWQWNDKEPFAFLAEHLVAGGAAFANIEYALCPAVTLSELTDQIRRALAYLWREADRFGYDRGRIVVSGHSAGGHLTAMMMATDWPAFQSGLPGDLVKTGCALSGLYDLEPVRLSFQNDELHFTPDQVARNSPLLMEPVGGGALLLPVGALEGPEFIRQSEDLAAIWSARDIDVKAWVMDGHHHFSIINEMIDPASELSAAIKRQMGLA